VPARILPRPLQPELPVWITAQSDETFAQAGSSGFNLLTNLNYKSAGSLRSKIDLYRSARRRAGFDGGRVSVMTHAYVAGTNGDAREVAGEALRRYFAVNMKLQGGAFQAAEERFLARQAADRVLDTVGLIGDAETCIERAARFADLGVDELCCLLDFGIADPVVLDGLRALGRVVRQFAEARRAERVAAPA
jgi:alkanesulfonate monooxygenase SsuD/methylene tetrahydromethanopterin reductase-like flavin-dependent oxidoreductase (luciferase family)